MSDSVWPHPWDSPGKNTGMGCHFLLQCIKVKSESEVAQSCPTLLDPWTAAYQAPPSMGFSRQEYWSGVPLPSPISMCLINGSDGKESACNAGDPGSILSWEDPLEKETATHSSILAWRIPWTEEPDRLQSMGLWELASLSDWHNSHHQYP